MRFQFLDKKQAFLNDCDLCPANKVWCVAFRSGASNMEVFVCSECQSRILTLG